MFACRRIITLHHALALWEIRYTLTLNVNIVMLHSQQLQLDSFVTRGLMRIYRPILITFRRGCIIKKSHDLRQNCDVGPTVMMLGNLNVLNFKKQLQFYSWNSLIENKDVNKLYTDLIMVFLWFIKRCIPVKRVAKSRSAPGFCYLFNSVVVKTQESVDAQRTDSESWLTVIEIW